MRPFKLTIYCLAIGVAAVFLAGCAEDAAPGYQAAAEPEAAPAAVVVPALSDMAQSGEEAFNRACVLCHGLNAAGTGMGPPLVHQIYEPGHHGDFSIRNAVRDGVAAHHWRFGNMPAIPGVADDDLENIICYIRELQRANGIFAGDAAPTVC